MAKNDKVVSCSCTEHWNEVGRPVFEDQVVHFKVECVRCGAVFWAVYDFGYFVFDPDEYALDFEE